MGKRCYLRKCCEAREASKPCGQILCCSSVLCPVYNAKEVWLMPDGHVCLLEKLFHLSSSACLLSRGTNKPLGAG